MKTLHIALILTTVVLLGSCAAKKNLANANTKLNDLSAQLADCQNSDKDKSKELARLEESNKNLKEQVGMLSNQNAALLNNVGNLATLSQKEAENLERSLESLQEKDLQIKTMRDAITKKDSVTLALVTSLKRSLDNIDDEDIEISVEKGVVYVSISDKLLFGPGSNTVTKEAKDVLAKVAKVLNDRPDIDFLVEGHTDDQPIEKSSYKDNWDLSVLRATAVVRVLQQDFKIDPKRVTAGGRSYYAPVSKNTSADGRAKNRRTRIVILPKLDQFFGIIEEGMKSAK